MYNSSTPTLAKLGATKFDRASKIGDLNLKVKHACYKLKKQLRTTDQAVVDRTLHQGLVKEVVGIQTRNDARRNALMRLAAAEDTRSDYG